MKIKEFDPVIYPIKIWVCIGYDIKELRKKFIQNDDIELQEVEDFNAYTQPVKRRKDNKLGIMIVFENYDYMSVEIISHEASHAAKIIFEHIDADMRPHEPFEYLLSWIAKCCEEVKVKQRLINNNK